MASAYTSADTGERRMALQDRDYMRRRADEPDRPAARWRTNLLIVGAFVALAGAALWLFRDARPARRDSAPAEGSLVVNVNTATQAELETVPGIGPVLASLIIAGRPYQSVDDLVRISGIGERSLERMRAFMTTDGETQSR
jgi:competence ComEA-like helix-hairpin-helix protein